MTTKIKTGLIAADAVETASIKDANVTAGKLATDSVTTVKIADGAVTQAKLNVAAATLPAAYIGGLRLSNDTDTDHDVNITAGDARDSTDAKDIILASEITKRIDAAWSVGDDAGGLDGTESSAGTPDASTLYYVWLILRSDTGVEDALFSESATAPTMPTNYDYKRLIGCVYTDSSANILAFLHRGDYFRYTGTLVADLSAGGSTSAAAVTLAAPANCLAHIYTYSLGDDEGQKAVSEVIIRETSSVDSGVTQMAHLLEVTAGSDLGLAYLGQTLAILTDSSSQIEYLVQEASVDLTLTTFAFTMLTRTDP